MKGATRSARLPFLESALRVFVDGRVRRPSRSLVLYHPEPEPEPMFVAVAVPVSAHDAHEATETDMGSIRGARHGLGLVERALRPPCPARDLDVPRGLGGHLAVHFGPGAARPTCRGRADDPNGTSGKTNVRTSCIDGCADRRAPAAAACGTRRYLPPAAAPR